MMCYLNIIILIHVLSFEFLVALTCSYDRLLSLSLIYVYIYS